MDHVLLAVYVVVLVGLLAMACSTLAWMLFAWRSSGSLAYTQQHDPDSGQSNEHPRAPELSFSLLVPARHEEAVLGSTLAQLAEIDYEHFEILVIVGHDDSGTAEVAQASAARFPDRIRVVVDEHVQKNKPRALNSALPHVTGDVIGVFDAEDVVHPGLLTAVARRMVADRCAALQAGVQLMNIWSNWFALRSALEYYFWFRSRLHYQAERGFIPLGGNTVFVRRDVVTLLGGWDGECLAEDCDLGVRLSSQGFAVSVMYEPAMVTKEEAPDNLTAFIRQRTRWNQGFLQVLFKRDWTLLPDWRSRALARFTLCTPFLQAVSGILLPVALIAMVVGSAPAGIAVFSFLPIVPLLITLAVEHISLVEFGRLFGVKARRRDHVRLFLGMPLYQAVLAYAAIRAVVRHGRGQHHWEKTEHVGLHLNELPASAVAGR
jgi:cellulose synthase/poly-beta-1,6-N-acetylglucosamine synthase-like glycosyltransferase